MPGGKPKGLGRSGGRTKGTPNKATQYKQMMADVLASPEGRVLLGEAMRTVQQPAKGTKRAIDVLREMMLLAGSLVAIYQPTRDEAGKVTVAEPQKLETYLTLCARTAADLARFESPTFKAIAVQEVPQQPAEHADGDAKVIGSIRKRSQQDAAAVYMRLVRGGKAA